jgi:predicted HTH transcriptional regulator
MYVKDRSEITNAEYRKMFGISDRTALRDLTAICEKGIFRKVGVTGRETKYILTRHEPAINPPYPSINMKHDKEERIK